MENQKVKDLSTAQSPKATDFIMLITNLTNNVLEKCQLSTLREILLSNNISDDANNALTYGSDSKLYVEDLNVEVQALTSSKLNTNLSNATSTTSSAITNYLIPDYSKEISIANSTNFTAPCNGLIIFSQTCSSGSTGTFTINNIEFTSIRNFGGGTQDGQCTSVIIGKNNVFNATRITKCSFYPFKGENYVL